MSNYDMNRFLADFARRTRANTKWIWERKKAQDLGKERGKTVYEVTQLINSLYGLIIVPFSIMDFDKGADADGKMKAADAEAYGSLIQLIMTLISERRLRSSYQFFYCRQAGFSHTLKLYEFLRHIRNSLAHGDEKGLLFYPLTDQHEAQIEGIILHDVYVEDDVVSDFFVKLTINEINFIIQNLIKIFESYQSRLSVDSYNRIVDLYSEILENGFDTQTYIEFSNEEKNNPRFKKRKDSID